MKILNQINLIYAQIHHQCAFQGKWKIMQNPIQMNDFPHANDLNYIKTKIKLNYIVFDNSTNLNNFNWS